MNDVNYYRDFFVDSQAGSDLLKSIQKLITVEHTKAENEPDLARDHVQRAKGIREVINLINSKTAQTQKPYEKVPM